MSGATGTFVTPGNARTAASASRAICWPTAGFSVWKRTVKRTSPPSTRRSWMNPNETMSRESPGKRTFLSASSTCSCVGILFLLFEVLVRGADDRDRFIRGGDDRDHVEIVGTDQTSFDHRRPHPVDQPVPHCTDEDQRMLGDVLHLQELPHHEELEGRADAARKDDERARQPHEMMQARKERAMPEDFVHEGVGPLFVRQMNGQPEGPRMALGLSFHRSGVRGFHQA